MPIKNSYYFLLLKKRVAQKVRGNNNADLPLSREEKEKLIDDNTLQSRTLDDLFGKGEKPNFREDTFDLLAKYIDYADFNDFEGKNYHVFADDLGQKPIQAFPSDKQMEIRAEVEKTLFPQRAKDIKPEQFASQTQNQIHVENGDYNQFFQNIENSQISINQYFYEKEAEDKTTEFAYSTEKLLIYLDAIIERFRQWQEFFVHIRGKQIVEINLLAREVNNPLHSVREGTIEELRELISKSEKRMMVLGDPGMGKSTSMQYLVQKDAQKLKDGNQPSQENRIPVYIELRFVTDSIFDLIVEEISEYLVLEPKNSGKIIENMLLKGVFSIFLDGLNETVKDKSDKIWREIQSFYKKYPECVYLVSSRPEEYRRRPMSLMPVFNLEPMRKEQQEEFLDRNTSAEVKRLISETLTSYPNLENFLGVPLLLFMLIRVVEQTGEVPKNDNQIIKTFLEGIYLSEEQKNRNFNSRQMDILFAYLAENYFKDYGGNAKLPYRKVAEYLRIKIQTEGFDLQSLEVLNKMVELQILDFSQERYSFKHQLFLDYFALKYETDFEF